MRFDTSAAWATLAAGLIACAACGPQRSAGGPPPPRGPMAEAFAVAFGQPAPYRTVDDGGDHVIYTPQALIEVKSGLVALISKGEIPGGCEACAGALTIDYLRRGPGGFSRVGSWPAIGGKGRFGAALPWSIRAEIDNGQTLVTRDDFKTGGCSSTTEDLITLTPAGPVKIATVVVATAYDPPPGSDAVAGHVSGAITPIVRGERFAVVLTGTASARQVFTRHGQVFTPSGRGATGC